MVGLFTHGLLVSLRLSFSVNNFASSSFQYKEVNLHSINTLVKIFLVDLKIILFG